MQFSGDVSAETSFGFSVIVPQMANTAERKSENDNVQRIRESVWL